MGKWPVRPDDGLLADLREDAATAVDYLLDAWKEIDRLNREVDLVYADDLEERARLAVDAFGEGFDPRGHFVYLLHGEHDRIIYVGRSVNVMSRLGQHALTYRGQITRVALLRCPDYAAMLRLEKELIERHRPPYNVVGVPRVSDAVG